MKTRILLIAAAFFCMFNVVNAQTNLGFETWGASTYSANDPTGWGTLNLDGFGGPASTLQEMISPGAGSSSARMITTTGFAPLVGAGNDTLPGMVSMGGSIFDGDLGIPYTQKPTSVDFMYKSNIMPGDTGFFVAQLTHWDGTQSVFDGFASMSFSSPAVNVWTPVNLVFQYLTADTPDTLQIIAVSSQAMFFGAPMPLPGSELQLDGVVINTGVTPCTNPTAAFTSSSTNLVASFTNGSTVSGAATYAWDFGDGSGSSTLPSPTYTYAASGTYNVCLTVTDSCNTDQICQSITVTGACATPTSNFFASPAGLTVSFADISSTTGTVTYAWDFGDGSGSSIQQNPSYTYLLAGSYNVCLTVTDNCGTNQSCQFVTVTAGGCTLTATASATDETTSGANDGTATVVASGGTQPYTYNWSNFATTASITGLAPGSYSVVVFDAAGCSASATVTVQAGGGACNLTAFATGTDETTAGANDGTATVTASGGTQPYTYSWSNFATTATITGLAPGSYTVSVSDAAGCSATATVTILAGGGACNLTVTTTGTDETSTGASDGTATVVAVGGTQPYTYTWSNFATTATITGLAPGSYTVLVSDAAGCSASGVVTIQPAGGACNLTVITTGTDETTAGANNGTATAVASGGTQPYTYTWSNFAATSTITGLAPGSYTVIVSDGAGCSASGSVVVQAAGGGCTLTATASATNESSAGANDGTATAFVTGGTQPYTYAWSNFATTATITNLAPGNYTVVVSDGGGCSQTAIVTVLAGSVNCQVQVNVSTINESSMGASDGSAMAVVTGGTQPYAYVWNTGATTSAIIGLAPGVYTCTVLDASQCQTNGTGVVQAFQCTLSGTMSSTDETGLGTFDGTATVTATGGTQPYTYAWNTFATTATITGLIAGFYDVTVTDGNGCTYMSSAAVNPGGVTCNLTINVSGTNESQAGASDGMASVNITNGTALITSWSTGATTSTITNLAPGDYTVMITDSLGCVATGTHTVAPGLIIGVQEQLVPTISVKVYPNPAVDVVNFEITGSERAMLMVFDFAGRLITELTIDQSLTELNTSELNNGMYFYQLVGKNSDRIGSGKFMIQR